MLTNAKDLHPDSTCPGLPLVFFCMFHILLILLSHLAPNLSIKPGIHLCHLTPWMLPSCWALPLRRQHTEYSQSNPALPGLSSHGMQSPSMRAKSWVHVLKTGPMVCSPRFKAQQTPSCWSSAHQWHRVVFPTARQKEKWAAYGYICPQFVWGNCHGP